MKIDECMEDRKSRWQAAAMVGSQQLSMADICREATLQQLLQLLPLDFTLELRIDGKEEGSASVHEKKRNVSLEAVFGDFDGDILFFVPMQNKSQVGHFHHSSFLEPYEKDDKRVKKSVR